MRRVFAFLFWGVVGVAGVPIVGIVFYLALSSFTGLKGPPAIDAVQITDFSWDRSGFDTVMLLSFSVRNDHDYAVKDIVIRCTHRAKSGTMIDENTRTLYDQIPAHGSVSQYKFNMGFIHSQVDRSICKVISYARA